MKKGHISLKWGTLKSWGFSENPEAMELMKQYAALGMSAGAAQQRDTKEQKELICKMIDAVPGKILLEWDDKYVTKKEAKKYVMEYDA